MSARTWTRTVRRSAALVGAVSLLAAGLGVATATTAAADTVPTGGDPQTVSADALPTWQINGVVWSQAIVGNTVYVAGAFTRARPPGVAAGGAGEVVANNAFAYDITTGNRVTSFHPSLNGQSNAVFASPDGSRVYFGGDFTTVDGVAHAHIAAFSTATNTLLSSFSPSTSARVSAIATTSTAVYVGGSFGVANGVGRNHLAAFNPTTGALLPWAPSSDDVVASMVVAPGGSRVVIGGRFTTLNGQPAWGMGAVDPTAGTSTLRWDANLVVRAAGANGEVTSLRTDGTQIYGSGYKFKYPGSNFEGTFGADPATGKINFVNDCHGDTYDVFPMGKVLYAASHAHECEWIGGFPNSPYTPLQHNFGTAFTTYPTGVNTGPDDYSPFWSEFNYSGQPSSTLLDWFPSLIPGTYTGQGQAAWSLTGNSQYVSYGGEFVNVSGTNQQGLVRFALPSIAPNKVRPSSTSLFAPVVVSQKSGAAEISFSTGWDRDNKRLTYRLFRDASTTPIYTTTVDSTYWQLPTIRFEDTGLAPGSSHTYRFTATDAYGNATGSPTSAAIVIASGAPAGQHDFFGRTVAGGWGSADNGGAWTPTTDPSAFAVSGGVGTVTLGAPNAHADTALATTATSAADVRVSLTADKLGGMNAGKVQVDPVNVTSSSLEADIAGRRVAGAGDYRAVVRIASDGLVWLSLVRVAADGTRTVISPESIVPNIFWTPGLLLNVHLQVLGGAPTTVQASVWAAGTAEPATWLKSVTDSTAGLQGPGSVALGAALGSTVSSAPITFSFDDLSVGGATNAVPTAAVAVPSCTLTACSFDGSASADSDGSIAAYAWTFGDGSTGTGATPSHTYATSGTYPVTLTVTDNGGAVATATRSLTVSDGGAGNLPPTAAMTAPSCTNLACSFDGSSSTDPDGTIASYAWSFGDGATASGATASHTYAGAGTFPVTLTVTDDKGATNAVSTSVTVGPANLPPTGVISAPSCTNLACSFSGATSSDPDGTIASYAWTFGDGGTATGATASHTYAAAGTFAVTLTVTDDKGASNTVSTSVTVAPANVPPTAVIAAPSCTNLACSFSGAGSTDSDGTIASYAWTFGDGGTATGATPSHTYAAAGTFTVGLTVTDDKGATSSTSISVTVAAANVPPTAVISAPSCTNLVCSFSGATSSDPDGTIASYAWTFGDTGTAAGATASHTYAAAGTYPVTLTVTDNKGATSTVSTSVTVTAGGVTPFATDSFTRTVAAGWGTADLGGAWTVTSTSSLTVSGGNGLLTLTAGAGNYGYLNGISRTSTDLQATVTTDQLATTSGIYVSLIGRHTATAGDYRAKVRLATNGTVNLSLVRTTTTGVETVIAPETVVSGLTYAAGTQLRVRLQVTGVSPTTVRARVWKVGTTEPATWTVSTTDATAAYQVAGSVGVFGYLSSASPAPAVIRFDDISGTPAA